MASRRSRKSKARKSKSRKSHKKGAMKWIIYAGGVFVLLLIIGVIFGYNAVRSYLRSDEFRVMLGEEAGFAMDGEAEFSIFEWDGWSVKTDEFSFKSRDGVQNLRASGIDAQVDIGAVWGGVYRIENIHLREIELISDYREDPNREIEERKIKVKKENFWDPLLPDEVEVTGVDVAAVNGRAVTDTGTWAWKNTSAKVRPGSSKGVYDLSLSGGTISTPLPLIEEVDLKSAKGRLSADRFYLLSSQVKVLDNALLFTEGDFGIEDKIWQFRGDVTGARIQEIISENWKQRLTGPLELSFEVNGQPDTEPRITGHLRIKEGMLTALPLLDRIAAYANTSRFRRLALNEASLDFEKVGSTLELTNVVLASEGLVRLEGMMRLEGNEIRQGDFRVGITPGTLAHIPGAETKVFKRGDLGLLWTPLKVSGTLDSPQEDLSKRLIAAAGERMFEMIPETGQIALKYSGKVIQDSTKSLLSEEGIILGTGRSLIDRARNILGQDDPVEEEGEEAEGTGEVQEEEKGAVGAGVDAVKKKVGGLFDIIGRPIPKTE